MYIIVLWFILTFFILINLFFIESIVTFHFYKFKLDEYEII